MRGRTNVPQRVRPTVNGDIISATVEGGAISVGDFVEYVQRTADEEVSDTDTLGCDGEFAKNIGQNYKVGYHDGYITLWDKRTLEPVSSVYFTVHGYVRFAVLSNGDLIVFSRAYYSSSTTGTQSYTISYIKNTDGQISVLNSITSNLAINIFDVCQLDSTHAVAYYATDDGSKFGAYVITFDATTGEMSRKTASEHSMSNYRPEKTGGRLEYISDGVVCFFGRYKAGSSYYLRAYLISIVESSGTYSWSDISIVSSTQTISGTLTYERIATNTFMFMTSPSYFAIFSVTSSAITLDLAQSVSYNAVSADITSVQDGRIVDYLGSGKCLVWISANSDTKQYCVLAEYDSALGSISLSNALEINKSVLMGYHSTYSDIALVRRSAGKVYQLHIGYDDTEDELVGAEDRNAVRPYAGGRAIGFAKTGGAVGGRIQVYIPHQS